MNAGDSPEKMTGALSKVSNMTETTAEAEYVDVAACTSQVIWIQSQLHDYAINMKKIPLYCDS